MTTRAKKPAKPKLRLVQGGKDKAKRRVKLDAERREILVNSVTHDIDEMTQKVAKFFGDVDRAVTVAQLKEYVRRQFQLLMLSEQLAFGNDFVGKEARAAMLRCAGAMGVLLALDEEGRGDIEEEMTKLLDAPWKIEEV